MMLDGYSFELYPHVWTLLTNNSLLIVMKASLVSVIRLSLAYPHAPDKARMNNHQASHLVSISLIFVFSFCLWIIWMESKSVP